MGKPILVTGAAGYIGSVVTRLLLQAGHRVIALDDLSTGNAWAIPEGVPFYRGDFANTTLLRELVREHGPETAIHFAAKTSVEESVAKPDLYRVENEEKTEALGRVGAELGLRRFIFSSTCAVYGGHTVEVVETTETRPENPYGASKLGAEKRLLAIQDRSGMKVAALRYFNVAGASLEGDLGQANTHTRSLVSVCAAAATGTVREVVIHGTDLPTIDGTGVRDYIHVVDLARAHLDVLAYLERGGEKSIFNCGYGRGFSVRQVISAMESAAGKKIRVRNGPRRVGDIPAIYSASDLLARETGWRSRHADLVEICRSAYAWETRGSRPKGP